MTELHPHKPEKSGKSPVFLTAYAVICIISIPLLLGNLKARHHIPSLHPYFSEAINYPPGGAWRVALAAFLISSLIYLTADRLILRRLKSWKSSLAVILSVIFILISMEYGIRVFTASNPPLHRPHPEYLWQLYPRRQGMADVGGGVRSLRVNSMGFRGDEISPVKPPDTYRIIILGDSSAFGYGVDQEEMFSTLLFRELEKSAPEGIRIEVINMAVPGYTTFSSRRLFLDRGIPLQPDLVIIAHNNDPDLDWGSDASRSMDGIRLKIAKCLYKSDLYLLFRKYVLNYRFRGDDRRDRQPPPHLSVPRVSPEELRENLWAIYSGAGDAGADVMIISMPRQEEGDDSLKAYRGIMEKTAREIGGVFVDLYRGWRDPDEEFFIDTIHPSPRGHRRMAREISMEIIPIIPLREKSRKNNEHENLY